MSLPKIFTALITPFKEGEVDYEGLQKNIEHQIDNKIEGLLVLGTTGEAFSLTQTERERLIKATIETAKGRAKVMVNTSSNSTVQTVEYTQQAEALGADVALVITPYYNCPMQQGIFEHFKDVSVNTTLPLCVYNHPKRTSRNIECGTLQKIARLPNIIGFKDSSGNMEYAAEILSQIKDLLFWSGDDLVTLSLLSLGAHGAISPASNLIPAKILQVVQAAANNDFQKAKELFLHLFPLLKALYTETNPIPIKAAMNICGLAAGKPRLPLTELNYSHYKSLHELLENEHFLKLEV